MGLLNIIRRMHFRQKLSIRGIARLTGVSRHTVTKHLAANTPEPKFATPDRQSKIDPFAEKLAGGLKAEAAMSRKRSRLHFDPGEVFQFDWSEDLAVLGGERTKVQMARIKLSHSRAFLLRAHPLQTHIGAHWHAFRVFGGVPERAFTTT